MRGLENVFPAHPVIDPSVAEDLSRGRPGDLVGILGRSWQSLLIDRGDVLPEDLLLLSDEGLKYYLPFFLGTALRDIDGNFPPFICWSLLKRLSLFRELNKKQLEFVQKSLHIILNEWVPGGILPDSSDTFRKPIADLWVEINKIHLN